MCRFFNYYSKFFYIFQDTRRLKMIIHNNYSKNLIKCQGRAQKLSERADQPYNFTTLSQVGEARGSEAFRETGELGYMTPRNEKKCHMRLTF